MDRSRYHARFRDQPALSGQQSVVNAQIGGHDAAGDLQIDDPHPYFKEIGPMGIVGQQRLNEVRPGRKHKPGRGDHSTGRIRLHVEMLLRSVSRGRKAWPQIADAEDEKPTYRGNHATRRSHPSAADEFSGPVRVVLWRQIVRKILRREILWTRRPTVLQSRQTAYVTAGHPSH